MASIGLDCEGNFIFAARHFWSKSLLSQTDIVGKSFGKKSAFLEFVGVLLSFITVPDLLKGKHVLLKVDNMACVHGWSNRGLPNDPYTLQY